MKPLVIFHGSGDIKNGFGGCADGFAAAFAAWLKLGDDAEYLPMQYGNVPEVQDLRDLVDEREVYVLDFSLPRAGMDELFRSAKRVVWLDHHASVMKEWGVTNGFLVEKDSTRHIILDDNKSGALLAWEYFHPGKEVPIMFKHIDDYDRWEFKLDNTKAFNKALWSYAPWSFDTVCNILDDTNRPQFYNNFISEGEAILRAHEQNVASVVKGAAMKCVIPTDPGYTGRPETSAAGLAANCPPHLTSDVGHELATQSGTFGLCWCMGKDGKIKCSLRSNGDYDVSAIAKAFGGGGHKAASGFETDVNTLIGWLK